VIYHDNSAEFGTLSSGVSVKSTSNSFGFTGDVHPNVVPKAILAKLTEIANKIYNNRISNIS
jgi:hypothetical protein